MLIKKLIKSPLVFLIDKLFEIMDTTMDDRNDEDRKQLLAITNFIRSIKSLPQDNTSYSVEQISIIVNELLLPFKFITKTCADDKGESDGSSENSHTVFRVEYDTLYNEARYHTSALLDYLNGIKGIPYSVDQFYAKRKVITYLWNAYHQPFFVGNHKRILTVDEMNMLFKPSVPFYIDIVKDSDWHQKIFTVLEVNWQ